MGLKVGGIRSTVLVAEDDALMRFVVADALAEAGFNVVETSDGDVAVQSFVAALELSTCEQVARGRRLLGWSRIELAAKVRLSETTARNSENGKRRITPANFAVIQAALEASGIMFNEDGASVILRDRK